MTNAVKKNSLLIEIFKKVSNKNKGHFLLKTPLNKGFYSDLNKLQPEEIRKIAKEIVSERGKEFNFDKLIIKLSDFCFQSNGSEFIRSSDIFLGKVLLELAIQTNGDSFIDQYKKVLESYEKVFDQCMREINDKETFIDVLGKALRKALRKADEKTGWYGDFPEDYKFSDDLQRAFSLIYAVAEKYRQNVGGKEGDKYVNNLGTILANRVLNPLITDSSPPSIYLSKKVQQASANNGGGDIRNYFVERIPEIDTNIKKSVEDYFDPSKKRVKNYLHLNRNKMDFVKNFDSIKTFIEINDWKCKGFGLFQGGTSITTDDGQKLRVPHRVAAIYKLIKQWDKEPNERSRCYDAIQAKAQEALENPSIWQRKSTRDFYSHIAAKGACFMKSLLKDKTEENEIPSSGKNLG